MNSCSPKSLNQNVMYICVSLKTFQSLGNLIFLTKYCLEVPYQF